MLIEMYGIKTHQLVTTKYKSVLQLHFKYASIRRCNNQQGIKTTGISLQTVRDIKKAVLRKRFADVDTSHVRYIAMDEISIKKRHTYATLIIDAQTQVLLAAIEGRTQADIAPFFEMLQERGRFQNIKGATIPVFKY